jgi:hypothetical protein
MFTLSYTRPILYHKEDRVGGEKKMSGEKKEKTFAIRVNEGLKEELLKVEKEIIRNFMKIAVEIQKIKEQKIAEDVREILERIKEVKPEDFEFRTFPLYEFPNNYKGEEERFCADLEIRLAERNSDETGYYYVDLYLLESGKLLLYKQYWPSPPYCGDDRELIEIEPTVEELTKLLQRYEL